jgi:cation transport ATPase
MPLSLKHFTKRTPQMEQTVKIYYQISEDSHYLYSDDKSLRVKIDSEKNKDLAHDVNQILSHNFRLSRQQAKTNNPKEDKQALSTMEEKKWIVISYTIYMFIFLLWLIFIWGATGYLVFFLNQSGAWFLLSMFLSSAINPHKWRALITNEKEPNFNTEA